MKRFLLATLLTTCLAAPAGAFPYYYHGTDWAWKANTFKLQRFNWLDDDYRIIAGFVHHDYPYIPINQYIGSAKRGVLTLDHVDDFEIAIRHKDTHYRDPPDFVLVPAGGHTLFYSPYAPTHFVDLEGAFYIDNFYRLFADPSLSAPGTPLNLTSRTFIGSWIPEPSGLALGISVLGAGLWRRGRR